MVVVAEIETEGEIRHKLLVVVRSLSLPAQRTCALSLDTAIFYCRSLVLLQVLLQDVQWANL